MKSLRWFGLLGLAVLTACSSGNYFKIRMEIPAPKEVSLDGFDNIILTDFLIKSEISDFDANQELVDYLSSELSLELGKEVAVQEANPVDEAAFEDDAFWKDLVGDTGGALVITGSLDYTQETRKALVGKERKPYDDPFPDRSRLATRKFFTLNMSVFFINVEAGEILFQRDFKETQGSDNPNQTAQFAFTDLLHDVKEKILRRISGGERVQERYLIYQ